MKKQIKLTQKQEQVLRRYHELIEKRNNKTVYVDTAYVDMTALNPIVGANWFDRTFDTLVEKGLLERHEEEKVVEKGYFEGRDYTDWYWTITELGKEYLGIEEPEEVEEVEPIEEKQVQEETKAITLTKAQSTVMDNLTELINQVRPLNTNEIMKIEVELNQIRVITNFEIGGLKRTLKALESKGLIVVNGIEVELTTVGKDYIDRRQERKSRPVNQDKPLTTLQKSMMDIVKILATNNKHFTLVDIFNTRRKIEGTRDISMHKYNGTEKTIKVLMELGYIKKVDNDSIELWGDDILELTAKGKAYLS